MKGRFAVILLVLCLLCGCSRAEGIPEGSYRGFCDNRYLQFTVEDGIISGELSEQKPYYWAPSEDDPEAIVLSNDWVFRPIPEGYMLYGAFVPPEFIRQPDEEDVYVYYAMEDGRPVMEQGIRDVYVYAMEDGRPVMELDIRKNGRAYMTEYEYFRTDYVHGADPQTFTFELIKPISSGTRVTNYRFVMEDGLITVHQVNTGVWSADADSAYAGNNRLILAQGPEIEPYLLDDEDGVLCLVPENVNGVTYMLLVPTDGGARLDCFFHIPEESELPEGYPFRTGEDFLSWFIDLTRTDDGLYVGDDYTLELREDGTFTLLKLSNGPWFTLKKGLTYAYKDNRLTITDGLEEYTLEVNGEKLTFQLGLYDGYARLSQLTDEELAELFNLETAGDK